MGQCLSCFDLPAAVACEQGGVRSAPFTAGTQRYALTRLKPTVCVCACVCWGLFPSQWCQLFQLGDKGGQGESNPQQVTLIHQVICLRLMWPLDGRWRRDLWQIHGAQQPEVTPRLHHGWSSLTKLDSSSCLSWMKTSLTDLSKRTSAEHNVHVTKLWTNSQKTGRIHKVTPHFIFHNTRLFIFSAVNRQQVRVNVKSKNQDARSTIFQGRAAPQVLFSLHQSNWHSGRRSSYLFLSQYFSFYSRV